MSKFKALTVRYLPDKQINERINTIAKRENRSLSQQALYYIEKGLEKDELSKEERIAIEQTKEEITSRFLKHWNNNK